MKRRSLFLSYACAYTCACACLCLLTSCSVMMAARCEGVSLAQVQANRTRGDMLACGARVLTTECDFDGQLVEVYRFQQERGSAARALMHGVLDVSTMGLWEVVGTPIEACTDGREYFMLRVFYNEDEIIQRMELL